MEDDTGEYFYEGNEVYSFYMVYRQLAVTIFATT